ncbi:hypothetical protein JF66_12285 [Cryobacterium sp. MLB-32]|uniref:rhodanese-like domain-containing protein n=1 Tax=Cryobacterium sp. MLB-32 TaxID=1529318 RepID=UPI0004E750BA|nr:rhodanese-like domain-containing protein [Cryobacterium sp. MLB-32]KFF59305.1 hypothetical protein JF66_12285 [Cryobacterium sp. MLB-32]
MKKTLATIVLVLTAAFGLTACSAPVSSVPVSSSPHAITADTVVIDVRTPAEYQAGHLEGAINIDAQSEAFEGLVTALPSDGDYVLYCSTGNRSGSAVARMTDLGFTSLTDAGGLNEASASTGLTVVATP